MDLPADSSSSSSSPGLLLTPLLLVFLALFAYHRLRNQRFLRLAAKLPGPPGFPLIGNALDLKGNPNQIFNSLLSVAMEYQDVAKIWVGPRLFVFLTHPADIELVLSSTEHLDKSEEYSFMKPWLGDGLLLSTGEKWRTHRKLIAPTFHLNVLRSFMGRLSQNAQDLVRRLGAEEGREVDVHDYISEATVETLIETVMGVKKEGLGRRCYDYAMAVMKLCDILHKRQVKFYLRPDFIFHLTDYGKMQKEFLSLVKGLTQKVLGLKRAELTSGGTTPEDKQEHRWYGVAGPPPPPQDTSSSAETPQTDAAGFSFGQASGLRDDLDIEQIGEKRRKAFLETLLEAAARGGEGISQHEVKEQLDTIMFEGHDTTAAAGSFFLCLMAAHPDIQAKCQEEVDRILGDNPGREVTFQDTMELKYLERCLMETLRLYPPVPAIARRLRRELRLVSSPLVVPADCTLVVAIWKLHRREDIYPRAETFDPDNFLPEKSSTRHFYSFVPFSAGPRSCVGRKYAMLKLKTLLASVLHKFRILPGLGEEEWKLQADIILKRADGFRIRLEPRK